MFGWRDFNRVTALIFWLSEDFDISASACSRLALLMQVGEKYLLHGRLARPLN
jgi:hypothetical protein